MARLLFLAHRLPYPPNKGDKVRSYHLLRHLARQHEVHLGTFVDDPDDLRHLDVVRGMCASMHVASLSPLLARMRSTTALAGSDAMTLPYYRNAGLHAWVQETRRRGAFDAVVVFSSAMAQYVDFAVDHPVLVDFVDVDSAKWSQYASQHRWPMSWLYRREGRALLAYERALAARAAQSFFVTQNEADLFRGLAPESAGRVAVMCNGVDAEFFAPSHEFASPFERGQPAVVFTGAMDYWPNVDAVSWFVEEAWPQVRASHPDARFHIVGRSPAPAVLGLAREDVVVTGTVPDVRPYLRHAAAVVAPLRVARGIQNKILEAMAMGRPVVASTACAVGIDAKPGQEFLVASDAAEFAREVNRLLVDQVRADAVGRAGRKCVVARYSWDAHLSLIDDSLAGCPSRITKECVVAA